MSLEFQAASYVWYLMVSSTYGFTEILVAVVPITGKQLAHQHHFVDVNPEWSGHFGSFGVKVIVLPVFVHLSSNA